MKLLYLSCHSILEYDEVKLFGELGIDVFSHGAYSNPQKVDDPKRPGLDLPRHLDLELLASQNPKEDLHPRLIEWADVIVVMHIGEWVAKNWEKFKGKRVIWRSIGQSTLNVENYLRPYRNQGLEIVRYSPRESTIPGYLGSDALIRFYKDPDEYKGWNGQDKRVCTLAQNFKERGDHLNFDAFEWCTRDVPRVVYGPNNESLNELSGGCLDYYYMKKALRDHRCYFYTGTYPAGYTLGFMEAYMTGCPVVALGRQLGTSPFELGQDTYEVPDFLDKYGGGLYSDDPLMLKKYVAELLNDAAYASKLSDQARAGAIELFGKEKIKKQWKEYLHV